ncbi:MAG: hypothetical protein AAF253_03545 [Pseudomonadota bacterium]
MAIEDLFHALIACHIVTGAIGLVAFWVPVAGRKGGALHRKAGRLFIWTMLATGGFAVGISLCTLSAPIATHPHLMAHADFGSAQSIAAIFGWMMLYLAVLTVNLAWYGHLCVRNGRNRAACRTPLNLTLQAILLVAAANCVYQGALIAMPLMLGISLVGFATVATNLWYLYKPKAGRLEWLAEHVKALVGTGISVYTAFFAFGAVRLLPEAALTPALWGAPLAVGLALILYHRRSIALMERGAGVRRNAEA